MAVGDKIIDVFEYFCTKNETIQSAFYVFTAFRVALQKIINNFWKCYFSGFGITLAVHLKYSTLMCYRSSIQELFTVVINKLI